jgi:SNF2 family DNA or RNA helicase
MNGSALLADEVGLGKTITSFLKIYYKKEIWD